jgi:hypothetical protein
MEIDRSLGVATIVTLMRAYRRDSISTETVGWKGAAPEFVSPSEDEFDLIVLNRPDAKS